MKPTFALDLTREAIALLHRTPKGWLTVGETAFDAPDLGDTLDCLRKTALGLSPLGVASKVILPNNQILYLELHAPGPSREDKRRQIMAGLVGRTPYDVEDLVFDWSGKGATVKVAVVARETLNQAEDFAVAHRLNPVSFVAIPEEGTFVGEVWFGPTNAADTILAAGEVVERDRDAVSVIAAPTVAPTIAPTVAAIPDPELESALAAPAEPATPQDDDPLPGLQEALEAEVTEADLAMKAPTRPDPVALDIDDQADPFAEEFDAEPAPLSISDPVAAEVAVEAAPEPAPAPDPALVKPEPAMVAPLPETTAEIEEAPFAHVDDGAAFPDDDAADPVAPPAPVPSVLAADLQDTDVPPAPSAAAMLAFSSRRNGGPDGTVGPVAPSLPASPPDARFTAPLTRPAPPARTFPGLVTAPSIPGTRAKSKSKPTGEVSRPAALGPTTVKSPARPGGTFGATVPPRNRSGFVFMIMVGLLLLSLALVAAWASFFLTQAADGTDEATVTEVATDVVDVPAIEDEMAADLQDPEELAAVVPDTDIAIESALAADIPAEDLAVTDLVIADLPVNIGGDNSGLPPTESVAEAVAEAATDPAPADDLAAAGPPAGTDAPLTELAETAADTSEEPAPASTIATAVSGDLVPVENQDEIFLSAMDAPPPALDALALPAPIAVADAPPDAPMPPPAFGTVYQFGSDGLLKPTPDGILSPAGIMLIAGKPPLLPPARSPVAAATAAAPAPVAPADPASDPATAADASLVTPRDALPETLAEPDPAMAGFRPRPRPEGLVPPDDGASLEPAAPDTDITLRPRPRPEAVLAAAAAARPAGPDSTVADLGAQGASLAAQAEAKLAAAKALDAENPSIIAISMRPAPRPTDLSRAVEAAVAAAVRTPQPEPEPEPEVELAAAAPESSLAPEDNDEPDVEGAAPSIPTKASVAKQATYKNAINLGKINLIGTYGTASGRYALIRQANGKYKKVEIGDRIDGGVVKAITETEVRYQKGGKLVSLRMPKA